ncbi:hypothetical protein BpHYR1_006282, partial [Brachionus plicatilis]
MKCSIIEEQTLFFNQPGALFKYSQKNVDQKPMKIFDLEERISRDLNAFIKKGIHINKKSITICIKLEP